MPQNVTYNMWLSWKLFQILGLLITYFLLVVQFANPSASATVTPTVPASSSTTSTSYE